jgi:hypothetical protein
MDKSFTSNLSAVDPGLVSIRIISEKLDLDQKNKSPKRAKNFGTLVFSHGIGETKGTSSITEEGSTSDVSGSSARHNGLATAAQREAESAPAHSDESGAETTTHSGDSRGSSAIWIH